MDIHLNEIECRVLGSLIEKEITTPESYPQATRVAESNGFSVQILISAGAIGRRVASPFGTATAQFSFRAAFAREFAQDSPVCTCGRSPSRLSIFRFNHFETAA